MEAMRRLAGEVSRANRVGREELGRRRRELHFGGHSAVVAPDGEVLARGAGDGADEVVEVELGVELLARDEGLASVAIVRRDVHTEQLLELQQAALAEGD